MGIIFQHTCQAKDLILFGTFKLQILLQNVMWSLPFDVPSMRVAIESATTILYALRTIKFPFEVKALTNLSRGMPTLKGMLRMEWTSAGRKICLNSSSCHPPVTRLMSRLTDDWSSKVFGLVSTLNVAGPLSHLSTQISIEAPLPTCHLHHFRTIFCAAKMLLHA